ncbi:class I adenylate-forming enzyme family protein [Mycobacterium vicinigordonae]|uniref:AMP-binding protein n=1 Tax=Mycobacterium vicinigordonae TaxID=1719132 RepID=A0A7D6HTS6_9MYCO|nr:AMP-binding protein [Mycobacterium vicinigordonae]QLL06513.1 AMP-binding protein [Mycobacterium vicinigordonae]
MDNGSVRSLPATFAARWERASAIYPGNAFLLFEERGGTIRTWTYAEFDAVVTRAAIALGARGVTAGDSIHLVLSNCPAFVALWLAAARIGAYMIPVDPASTSRDIGNQTRRVHPVLAFCAAERADTYRSGSRTTVIEVNETSADVDPGGPLDIGGRDLVGIGAPTPMDWMAVMFTSGTTSVPKGVVLTQHNYAYVADTMSELIDLRAHHRWLATLPLFHANAQYYCFASAIAVGASVALTAGFSASRWVTQARTLGATHASLFAAPIRMILARNADAGAPLQLDHVWFAQNLGASHYEEFSALVGCKPRQLYGMTETLAVVTCDLSSQPRCNVIGSVAAGRPILIVDPDTGEPTIDPRPGELVVGGKRGETLFVGYLDDEQVTEAVFEEAGGIDWFHTADIVSRADDGHLEFVGRSDDVIKVAGENVSLAQVEAVVSQSPGVLEAAVIAGHDPVRGAVPIAYVVPKNRADPPAVESLERWATQELVSAMRPRKWHIIDALPRTSVGKIRKFKLPNNDETVVSGLSPGDSIRAGRIV